MINDTLDILIYPNQILDTPSENVDLPLDDNTLELIRKMWQTVQDKGIGLAAPQVGVNKQICIIHLDPEIADKKDKKLDFVMINPKITFYSEIKSTMLEGCLSFPEQYYEIKRPSNISVEFDTIANFSNFISSSKVKPVYKKAYMNAKNWMSRVIQHEVDHLNAKLFINLGGKKIEPEALGGRTDYID